MAKMTTREELAGLINGLGLDVRVEEHEISKFDLEFFDALSEEIEKRHIARLVALSDEEFDKMLNRKDCKTAEGHY